MQPKDSSTQVVWAYVYVIRSGDCRKIGYTLDLKSRIAQLQTGSPVELVLEQRFVIDRRFATFAEFLFHAHLKQHQAHGEWFRVGLPEIEAAYRNLVLPQLKLKNAHLWEDRERPSPRRARRPWKQGAPSPLTPWQAEMIKATDQMVDWLDLRLAEHRATRSTEQGNSC
jgi:hypothetical protein